MTGGGVSSRAYHLPEVVGANSTDSESGLGGFGVTGGSVEKDLVDPRGARVGVGQVTNHLYLFRGRAQACEGSWWGSGTSG